MPRMTTPAPISADRLEHLLQERQEMSARPRMTPREVFAKWLDNAGVGVGVGVAAAVGLAAFQAPEGALLTVAPSAGLLAFAITMAWRGTEDERSGWRNTRAIKRTVAAMKRQYDEDVASIRGEATAQTATMRRQLDAAFDEIEALERALDQTANERNIALLDLGRERKVAATRTNFVKPEDPATQDVLDAREMIRYYFDQRRHLSRRRAADDKRWSAERWKAAQGLLERAGVLAVNTTQPAMLAQTLDEALNKLDAYLTHARSQEPPIVAQARPYVEYEDE